MAMPSRDEVAAARAEIIGRLQANMPQAMRALPQWLLWRLEMVEGRGDKPQKVPYYANGRKRFGNLGGPEDRAALVSFDAALQRFAGALHFTGVGFAFLDGDGLIGVDLDGMFDLDTGSIRDDHLSIVEACASYTERSVSGAGAHVIVAGHVDSFKHDPVGIEVYCGGRYFTCTGDRLADTPAEVRPLKPYALVYMQDLVQKSKDDAKAARAKAAAPAGAVEPAPVRQVATHGGGQLGNDFIRVNAAALVNLQSWVPQALPAATAWRNGFRVTSKALGRDLQEDLQLVPEGIMDFGEECGMSPIDVLIKWYAPTPTAKAALHWLAPLVGVQLAPARAPRLRVVKPDADPPAGAEPDFDSAEFPPPPLGEEAAPEGGAEDAAPRGPGGRRRKPRAPREEGGGGGTVERLLKHYALVRGTDQVWDGETRSTMAVKNLRLLWGAPYVNTWLAHPERQVLLAEQIKFEPGADLPLPCVNLFDGLPLTPIPSTEADVEPMLELLRHLTSLSMVRTDKGLVSGGETVFWQVVKWCAMIVQRPGAKSRFAMVFHGPQGTGKNMYWDAFRRILGKYGKMVGQTELEDRFNGYMSGKLLLIGNEVVTRQELWHNKNKLKWVITEDEIPIRGMHQEVRWESNHANLVFLSNEIQPVALEKDDRRHLVVYTPATEDKRVYADALAFLADDGHAKFMGYLMGVDLEGFHEHTYPLMTEAKEKLIDLGLKPAERFVNEWIDGLLDLPMRMCSASQLYRIFVRWVQQNGERNYVSQATFTTTVQRHVYERVDRDQDGKRLAPRLYYKQINLKYPQGHRKTVRCWVPGGIEGPPAGVTEGEWACSAVESFERDVSRYGHEQAGDDS